jgi:outer membrane receptor for ferrienterochelin and colicin
MHIRFYSFLLLFLPLFSFSQTGTLKLIVVEHPTKEAVIGASVTLLSPSTQAYLRGGQTEANGRITLENVGLGEYTLKISYLGTKDYVRERVRVEAGKILDLGVIALEPEGRELGEVVVQGKLPELQLGIDKKVFDVSQSTISAGGSAEDVLGNVPTLQVDSDGSISLRGSTGVKILIDGKESAMAGSDISKLLQSLPAEAVSKVEIMTNPSARYDAEGQSGIINIVLKKDIRTGLNGTVNASVGSYNNYSGGLLLNYRDTKFNYFGSYNFNHRNHEGLSTVRNVGLINGEETAESQITNTHSDTYRTGKNHSFRVGTDYYATEKTTVGLGANFSLRDNNRGEDLLYKYINQPEWGNESPRRSRQSEQDFGYDLTFDFRHMFAREGEELLANATFGDDREVGVNDYVQTFETDRFRQERYNETGERGQNWNFQLDYVLPLGDNHKFEAGYKTTLRGSDEHQYSDTLGSDGIVRPDFSVSNDFEMRSGVHALYANYQRMLSDRIGMQVGIRAEDAYLNTTNTSLDPALQSADGKLEYFRVYPSAFLTYDVNKEGDKLQMSYTRRVQRPRGWQVNPFVDLSDETNLRQGNANLMPEDIHSFELSFAKFYTSWNFITSAYYRRVNDMTQPFQYDIDDPVAQEYLGNNQNATFSRWENVGSRNNSGIELIAKVNLFQWWDATGNLNMFYSNVMPYANFDVAAPENFGWNGNVLTNIRFTSSLSAQIKGDYRAPMKTLQGKMKSMAGMDFALRQDVLKRKGTLSFNVRDVFDSKRFGIESYLPTRNIDRTMRWSRRTFNLSFSYRFGIQDASRNKKQNNDMPMDDGGMEY